MSVPIAFIAVILIWSTTPLGIKWSGEGVSFMFAVTTRMIIGTIGCLMLVWLTRGKMLWHKRAVQSYLAAGLGIYGAMSFVYWGAQFIPSGLISVIFGLTPLITGLMAALWLNESSLTAMKLLGMASAFSGLFMIFGGNGVNVDMDTLLGMLALLLAVIIHSLSTVWVKKISAGLPVISMTGGSMLVALPLYLITWYFVDGGLPQTVPIRSMLSILYLGVFGSVLGFILFFYVLQRVEAGRVGLIPLITPVSALFLGLTLNNETIPTVVWSGTGFILTGMALYQWGDRLFGLGNRATVPDET
ncbi:MAG: DMT family transporter [Gammaproteobacteria bacterium]|nr:DMT family transporter [Gammaproteobacteria bacterium]MDH5651590.1 DMT family transporter [Gammaproteobacteria bacterium]